jgi:hypothetical protein
MTNSVNSNSNGRLSPDQVREQVKNIFETLAPKNQFVTDASVKAFSQLFSPDATSFQVPMGGLTGQHNPTPDTVYQWFKDNYDPDKIKYAQWILGDIHVAGNTASFRKAFFASLGQACVHAEILIIAEIDNDGKLLQWIAHFDAQDAEDQFAAAAKLNQQ